MVYDFLVALPLKKVILKRIKGIAYVYYNESSFRNKKGQPSSIQVSIGRLDQTTGKLYPNQRYFDYFPDQKPDYLPNQTLIKRKWYYKRYTVMKVQLELRKIRLITLTDKNKMITKLTKTQRGILEALKLKLPIYYSIHSLKTT